MTGIKRHFRWIIPVLVSVITIPIAYEWTDDTWGRHEHAVRGRLERLQVLARKLDKAGNLEPYRQQMVEMQDVLSSLLRQLPSRMVEPAPWAAMAAESSGMTLVDINRQDDLVHEFYVSSVSSLRMEGSYPQFLKFVETLNEMSPDCPLENLICGGPLHTISNVTLRERRQGGLRIDLDLQLFRYLAEDENE